MEFEQLVKRAMKIRERYAEKETQRYGSPWTNEEIALGLVGDLGDLAKLIVAANGKRDIPNSREKLAHELADCLWSVMVLSQAHGIDLEHAFLSTMDDLEKHLAEGPA